MSGDLTKLPLALRLSRAAMRTIQANVAVKNPDLVRQACRAFPGRVVLGIDARGGRVAVEGWAEVSEIDALDLARRFEDAGAAAIVYTDIDRDGALEGANVEATRALAEALQTPVIASGGVATLDDLAAFLAIENAGIEGVISGRALYDGRIDPAAALALLSKQTIGTA
jgi:phosphoribosylformimino-5-aminoimidazole carboxamide ribotide isomerase